MTMDDRKKGRRGAARGMLLGFTALLIFAAAAFGLSPAAAFAAEERAAAPADGTVTLEGLLGEARENNPRVKAARMEWERVKERYPQAVSLDDPMLTYTQPVREVETRLGPQERMIGLSQRIPFPGKLGARGEIVQKEVEIARTRYEKTLRDLAAEVKKAFSDLYFIDRATELDRENKAVLDYFFDVSRTNYGLDVSELDELVRAQKSSAMASLDLLKAREMREAAVARINTLLDRPPHSPLATPGEIEPGEFIHTPEELYEWAAKNNEEVRIAGLEVEKSELEKRLAGYAWRPDFNLGVNYTQIGDTGFGGTDAGTDAFAVTFGMNIPLWFSKNRAAVSEKEMGLERRLFERSAAVTDVTNRVRRVYFDLLTARDIMDLYGGKLIPEAKESVDFAEARYKTGREMLGRMLETQSMWINFRLVYYRAVADYFKSVAELERLTARELVEYPEDASQREVGEK